MARFPVEAQDPQSMAAAINYALSGPSSLGQNFSGVSFSEPGWLTGNFAPAFTSPTLIQNYVAPVTCSLAEKLSANTFKYTFAAAQPAPPFFVGANITASGFAFGQYNRTFFMGVVECTTTEVIARTRRLLGNPGIDATPGTVSLRLPESVWNATDCDIRDIKIQGGTETAFVSAQVEAELTFTLVNPASWTVRAGINRYRARPTNDPTDLDFVYDFDKTIAYQSQLFFFSSSGTFTDVLVPKIFVNVQDQPGPGLFRYILELDYEITSGLGDIEFDAWKLGYRSLSCQVIKQ